MGFQTKHVVDCSACDAQGEEACMYIREKRRCISRWVGGQQGEATEEEGEKIEAERIGDVSGTTLAGAAELREVEEEGLTVHLA